jgi:nitrate/nitrite transport system substrate-binding protein
MVANLRAGNIDGFLGPDPVNQRAVYDGVGFIHILTATSGTATRAAPSACRRKEFVKENPNTFAAAVPRHPQRRRDGQQPGTGPSSPKPVARPTT